jgi:secernin
MCDTLISTPQSSAGGCMILAKNSDRVPNEAQNVTFVPAQDHPSRSNVRCTTIDIPQANHTFAVLLSRPFWMFGAEMGVNEHGVAIGNEAVFTREPYHKKNDALLGMDMLRIALERSRTACQARDLIIELLDHYGQGGRHAPSGTLYYHNSFMIADPGEAYILETAGAYWVWKKVADVASISNCLTIGADYDGASPGLEDYARARGYVKRGALLDFRREFSDMMYTFFARGRIRQSCTSRRLMEVRGSVTGAHMMQILRDHNMPEPFHLGRRPMEGICLHAGGVISTQTTGSMVAMLHRGLPPLVYLTGTSAPCLNLYKPHTLTANQRKWPGALQGTQSSFGGVDLYGSANDTYRPETLWWRGEEIHRRAIVEYSRLSPVARTCRDDIEGRIGACDQGSCR